MIKVKTLVMPIGITTTLSNHYASANVEERYVKKQEDALNETIKQMENNGYEVFDVKVNHFVCEKHNYADDVMVQYTIMGRK